MSIVRAACALATLALFAVGCSSAPAADQAESTGEDQSAIVTCPYYQELDVECDPNQSGHGTICTRQCLTGRMSQGTAQAPASYACSSNDAGVTEQVTDSCSGPVDVPPKLAALGCTTGVLDNETYVFLCPTTVSPSQILALNSLGIATASTGQVPGSCINPPTPNTWIDGQCEALGVLTSSVPSNCFGELQSGWQLVIDRIETTPSTPGECSTAAPVVTTSRDGVQMVMPPKCILGGVGCNTCGVSGKLIAP